MIAGDGQLWQKLTLLALTGAAGTLARYGMSGFVQRIVPGSFPWGTLAVNALGCLAFGVVWALAEERMVISGQTRIILLIGFMGSFTTFSTLAFETSQMLDDSQWFLAAANLLAQNVSGILLVWCGIAIGKFF
jgi:CrcB protein